MMTLVDRAKQGRVVVKANSATAAGLKRTKVLETLQTRPQWHAFLLKLRKDRVQRRLKPGYLHKRVWYIKWYSRYMLETWGESPWRVVWGKEHWMTPMEKTKEEEREI